MKKSLPVVIIITSDLFFGMRIKNTIEQLGGVCLWIDKNDAYDEKGAFLQLCKENVPKRIILDLASSLKWEAWLSEVKNEEQTKEIEWVGYGSHVEKELLDHAREIGVDEVLARSKFTKMLPSILE